MWPKYLPNGRGHRPGRATRAPVRWTAKLGRTIERQRPNKLYRQRSKQFLDELPPLVALLGESLNSFGFTMELGVQFSQFLRYFCLPLNRQGAGRQSTARSL